MKAITRFKNIILPYTDSGTLNVAVDSKFTKSLVTVLGADIYYTEINTFNNTLEIHPNMEWPSGSEITITLDSIVHKYIVSEDINYYAPLSYLYSSSLLGSADLLDVLFKAGMATLQEKELLTKLEENSPKLFELLYNISVGCISEFRYDSTAIKKPVTVLKLFRRLLQLLYMYGLESIVSYYNMDISLPKDWFLDANILGIKSDTQVNETLFELEVSIKKLINVMQAKQLNLDITQSLKHHMDPKLPQYKILETAVVLLLAIRASDNGELKY
jgi:hypothetical protein